MQPGALTATVAVRDGHRLSTIYRVGTLIKRLEQKAGDSGDVFQVKESKYLGTQVHYVRLGFGGAADAITPCWCFADDRLVVSSNPRGLKDFLARDAQAKSLANRSEVVELFKGGEEPSMIIFQDTVATLRSIYPDLQSALQKVVQELANQGLSIQVPPLPSLAALERHARPSTTALTKTPHGIVLEEHKTVPLINPLITAISSGAAMYLNEPLVPNPPLLESPSTTNALAGREGRTKAMLLSKYGGNRDSEKAVAMGLDWLARNQRSDGTWSLKGPYRSGSISGRDIPESATALALLAFQGAGNTSHKGEYKKQVASGINALVKMQGSDGNFFQQGGAGNNWFYAHGQCTIAICELYAMTKDRELKRPAELAVQYCIASQDPELGGWKYLPRSGSDTSVTGWITMALQSARMAGLEIPPVVFARLSAYLGRASSDGSRYGYEVDTEPTLAMTAEALLCRQYLGWRRDDPRLVQGVDLLMKSLPRYEDRDVYYWYYATQVMHHMEGKYWNAWNDALRDMLIKNQETTGLEKGSWDPLGKHPDRWSNLGQGMRLYTTCMSLYMLEAYYRHLPIYAEKQ